jgi:2-polyprenyl-3-methyl-5-hydroxy-6-metoxy-1,4-benzoquinol methylase
MWLSRPQRTPMFRPAWTDEDELMDRPGHPASVVAENLADLRRVNAILGGVRLTLAALEDLAGDLRPGAALSMVDVGTGGGDIPPRAIAWARSRGLRPSALATDPGLEIVRAAAGMQPRLAFVVADGRHLPLRDGAFDVATCSLVLHHLPPEGVVALLEEMARVSRLGVVVNDIVRWWPGYWGAFLLSRLFSQSPLTRHDGPLSVRKAYTRHEMADLVARAGLRPLAWHGYLGYRVSLALVPST